MHSYKSFKATIEKLREEVKSEEAKRILEMLEDIVDDAYENSKSCRLSLLLSNFGNLKHWIEKFFETPDATDVRALNLINKYIAFKHGVVKNLKDFCGCSLIPLAKKE